MGSDWLAGSVCYDWLNRLYYASECPAPHLSGMCSGCIVNNGVVYIAYQEPEWNAEDIYSYVKISVQLEQFVGADLTIWMREREREMQSVCKAGQLEEQY